MATIVTRAGKGSALTWTEGDANITNLNNDKIEAVVDDTAPQLGGTLDVNGNVIDNSVNSTDETDIVFGPASNTYQSVRLVSQPGMVISLKSDLATGVSFNDGAGTATNINLNNAGLEFYAEASAAYDMLTFGVTGGLTFKNGATINGGDSANANLELTSNTDTNISLAPGGTGIISLSGLSWPQADGTNGQVLTTDGNGVLSFQDAAGGGGGLTALVDDTAPQLGGTLDVNGNVIDNSVNDGNTNNIVFGPETNTYNTVLLTSQSGMNLNIRGSAGSSLEYTDAFPNDASVSVSGSGVFLYASNPSGSDYVGLGPQGGLYFKNGAAINGGDSANANLELTSNADTNISLAPGGTGKVVISGNQMPTTSGSNGQVLTTNGSGTLSWATASSGGPSVAVLTMSGNGVNVSGTTYRTTFTEVSDPGNIVSLADSNNRFVLDSGTYVILSQLQIFNLPEAQPSSGHLLYNITNSTDLVNPCADKWTVASNTYAYYPKTMSFTLTSSKTIEYRFTRSNSFYINQHLDILYIFKLA